MMKIAILGCGNISQFIANAIYRGIIDARLVKVFDIDRAVTDNFQKYVKLDFGIAESIDDLIEDSDLVVEAASQNAIKSYGLKILESGKNLMIMSVGALSDESLFRDMKKAAKKNGVKIYIPSGAIAGLDAMNAAKLATIESVSITTRTNPTVFDLETDEETVLFEGPASEGVCLFPKSVNVAATTGLAGIGLHRTTLKVIADPKVDRNTHEICFEGDFGKITTKTENTPSLQNPKTSWIAALSAIAMLRKMDEVVQIGT